MLGHKQSKDGISMDTSKTDAVQTFSTPQNTTDVRAFLGLANYYKRFCKSFSHLAAPLHNLLIKGAKFIWTSECEAAFVGMKRLLTSQLILFFPDFTRDFISYTDALHVAIGYVLGKKIEKAENKLSHMVGMPCELQRKIMESKTFNY